MVAAVEISPREAEVLALVGEHLSNAEISAKLYISVRTVESHISSLLRKLDVPDRRALARRAPADRSQPVPALPAPLTSFVGRSRERTALAELLDGHRQVTVVGPGGVGKTRLVTMVAADVAGRYADGVWFVDLVPVTDPGLVAAAVGRALGLGEQPGRAVAESVIDTLADRHTLLVLDNCEQVRDGVAPFLERLLATCPRVTALATSRARLVVPFERVYSVPPLSDADAVTLFLDRSAADPALRADIAAICRRLDGVALAIELAAARFTTLGPDGLTAGLSDQLRMLSGGPRADERHSSVRAALDWSHALLDPADRALLRRVSVFVAPFTVDAAARVTGTPPGVAADGLARLAEQSLLTVRSGPGPTEYRALESVRQYGVEKLAEAGELDDARTAHLRWCLATAEELSVVGEGWRARFDQVADDLRAALTTATDRPTAHRLARRLADLTFTRHLISESQQRYEQAAALADDPADAAAALRLAAAVAGSRMRGDEMYLLLQAAAGEARSAGDPGGAAVDLATAATNAYRYSGKFVRVPTEAEAVELVDEARELAGDDPAARAAVALAEAGVLFDAFGAIQGPEDNDAPQTTARAERAVALAHATGDPLAECAALDALLGAESWAGDAFGAADTARRRIALLEPLPDTPTVTHELIDALGEAAEASLGVGDLAGARRWSLRLAEHPLMAEVGDRALSWLLVTEALAGDFDEALTRGDRFLEAWQRAGGPVRPALGPAVAAVAMVHDVSGDSDARDAWLGLLAQLGIAKGHRYGYRAVFDAIGLLHHGRAVEARERLAPEPGDVWRWVTWIWLHWYVALRAEAAVLAGAPDAADRIAAARDIVAGNPVAEAMVERAEALLRGDTGRALATVAAFDAAGCVYQAERTRFLAASA